MAKQRIRVPEEPSATCNGVDVSLDYAERMRRIRAEEKDRLRMVIIYARQWKEGKLDYAAALKEARRDEEMANGGR